MSQSHKDRDTNSLRFYNLEAKDDGQVSCSFIKFLATLCVLKL